MDLSLPIVGLLAYIGYNLNDKKTPREVRKTRTKISPHEKPSGKNIYHSTFTKEIDAKERKIADIQFKKSKNPENTNIIPPLYNSYCKWDCEDKSAPGVVPKKSTILPGVKPLPKEKQISRETQILSGPMFTELFINGGTVGSGEASSPQGPSQFIKEGFENISELSGSQLDLRHNNMVPFFGSNVTQNMQLNKNSSILENHTGIQDTPTSKREVTKMFSNKKENVFGSRPMGDTIAQDRYVQSNLKTNLLPAPQVKVQPLPEECVRPSYKRVDDLRVLSNPKVSYKPPVVQGKHFVANRGIQSKVSKNKPETFYKNGPERYFTNVGEVKAPRARENFSAMKLPSKAETSEKALNVSPAYDPTRSSGKAEHVRSSQVKKGDKNVTIVDDDTRQTFKADWVRNAKFEINSHNHLDRDGYVANEQERETTNRMTILPANDNRRGYHQALPDQARTTHKETNLFSYSGNASAEVEKGQDYTSAYNYTREKQSVNNPDYKGIAGQTTKSVYDMTQYENAQIFSGRETVADLKGYSAGPQKENTPLGANGVNMYQRDDEIRKNKHAANVDRVVPEISNMYNLGCPTYTSNKETTEHDFSDRIDPELLEAHRKNPYTQGLNMY